MESQLIEACHALLAGIANGDIIVFPNNDSTESHEIISNIEKAVNQLRLF
jgi:hypothetical protein